MAIAVPQPPSTTRPAFTPSPATWPTEYREAIVVGAGPAGLAVAAELRRRGVETLLVERSDAVGASWRGRYEGLRLNTMRVLSSLPGHPMPRAYGRYPRREERVERGPGGWELHTNAGALRARHLVIATGYDAAPRMPDWPGADSFPGELIHASAFRSARAYHGRDVLVVGAGNTGVDIAEHLRRAGAIVTVCVRTPPNLFPRQWHGIPLQALAVVAERLPLAVRDRVARILQDLIFGDLTRYGLGRPDEGIWTKFRRTQTGQSVDDGFVAALRAGQIRVVPEIARFEGADVVLTDGRRLRPDVVIAATGYRRGLEGLVGHLGVLSPTGSPAHYRAAPAHPAAPRLYFAGYYGAPSGQLRFAPIHARRIARAVIADRRSSVRRRG